MNNNPNLMLKDSFVPKFIHFNLFVQPAPQNQNDQAPAEVV